MSDFVIKKLDLLAELRNKLKNVEEDRKLVLSKVLPPELVSKYEAIEAEFEDLRSSLDERIEKLEDEIKEKALEEGETIRGTELSAVWVKGRRSWDGRGLEAYSKDHSELLQFRREGSPSVQIRKTPQSRRKST